MDGSVNRDPVLEIAASPNDDQSMKRKVTVVNIEAGSSPSGILRRSAPSGTAGRSEDNSDVS